ARGKHTRSGARTQSPGDPPVDLRWVGAGTLTEDGKKSGAGILRIDVDPVGAKCLKGDLGGAEAETAVYLEAAGLQQLGKHFSQQIRFAERLGGDDDGTRPGERRLGGQTAEAKPQQQIHRPGRAQAAVTRARSSR